MGHVFPRKTKRYGKVRRKTATINSSSTVNGEKFVRILDTFGIKNATELKNIDPIELKKFKKALEKGVPYRGTKSSKEK